jgi:selenocysteine lyase/cysteine desulfurase
VGVAAGHQCAPLAHETLGTERDGVIRISVGPATTDAEVAEAAGALTEVLGA